MKKEDILGKVIEYFGGDTLAAEIFIDKYALHSKDGDLLESSPDEMHRRLARELARIEGNYPNGLSEQEIYDTLKDFKHISSGGSPIFGIGNDNFLTSLSNCFVIGSNDGADSYGSIMKTDEEQVQLMKRRGGVGHDISHIRPKGALVGNSALSSAGIVPLMERYSNSTREVAQYGRRGALMLSLSINHPDAEDFIDAKLKAGKVTGANISVKITDEFMKAVQEDRDFLQSFPINIEPLEDYDEVMAELKYGELVEAFDKYNGKFYVKKIKAKQLWNKITHNGWKSAEPGVLFWDKIISESPADSYGGDWKTVSTNPCLSGDTWVTTENGPSQIIDLVGKGKVKLLKDGKFYKTTEDGFFETGYLPVYEMILSNGVKIRSTNNHKFMTNEGWVELKNLEVGNKIILSNNKDIEWKGTGGTKEEGWLLGNFIGDGNYENSALTAKLQYWGDNKEIMVKKAFDLLETINHSGKTVSSDSASDIIRNRTAISSRELFQLADSWGVMKNNKYLTPEIEKGSSDFYKGIIGGLFDADGCVYASSEKSGKGVVIDISQSNLPLLEQAQRMLSRLGILSTISLSHKEGLKSLPGPKYYEEGEIKEYYCKNCYILRIGSKVSIDKFFKDIYVLDEDKLSKYKRVTKNPIRLNKPTCYSKIKSISYSGTETVYDCTVPEISCFDANNIIVHNCGEVPLCPYDSCRLMSLNLYSYVENPFTPQATFNKQLFSQHVRIAQRLMDDIIDLEIEKLDQIIEKIRLDPEPPAVKQTELMVWTKIRDKAIRGRRTGLGVTAEGDMLAALGLKYGTSEATGFSEEIHKLMAVESYKSSIEMAKERGAFPDWNYYKEQYNPFINRVVEEMDYQSVYDYSKFGRRNISNLTIAPTGTTSMMTQTTSGIEPVFQPFYQRRKKTDDPLKAAFTDEMGDMWEEFNVFHHKFVEWYKINYPKELGYVDATELKPVELDILYQRSPYYKATANDVDYIEKVHMQGKIQQWVDHSISVTVNMPADVTEETVANVYMEAWKSGCKGITVYRDGCRSGVLLTGKEKKEDDIKFKPVKAFKRPTDVPCDIHIVKSKGEPYVVMVGILDGHPYETFAFKMKAHHRIPEKGILRKHKTGWYNLISEDKKVTYVDNISLTFEIPDEENITRLVSGWLRSRGNVKYIVDILNKSKGDITTFAKVIARVLKRYIADGEKSSEKCPVCGNTLVFEEGCLNCKSCGHSKCG